MGRIPLMRCRVAATSLAIACVLNISPCNGQSPGNAPAADRTATDDATADSAGTNDLTYRDISTYDDLVKYARQVASQPGAPRAELPAELAKLDYDLFRMIAFRSERALWKKQNLPFWFEFFHRGFVHRDRVEIHLIAPHDDRSGDTAARVTDLPFSSEWFQYRGPLASMKVPAETGFAGLRILGKFPGAKHPQEILTFLGASYFRGHSEDTVYGTSARGLAVNPAAGVEEFPVFREFWIQQPGKQDDSAVVLALLDGPSVAGAYEFTLHPGTNDTVVDVRSTLYFRNPDVKIGIAPLTSMWMWGDGLAGPPKDPRPSVHDADGLQIHDGERWIWRPLSRQEYPSLSGFAVTSLKGFGLIQRARDPSRYLDDEARYHARPSVWIEAENAWSGGTVELFEMPAIHEGHDNIVAYWVPGAKLQPLEPLALDYHIHFSSRPQPKSLTSLATVQQTTIARRDDGLLEFGLTFAPSGNVATAAAGKASAAESIPPENASPDVDIATIRAELVEKSVERKDGQWIVRLTVRPVTEKEPIEVRATLVEKGVPTSETWTYLAAQEAPPYRYPNVYTRQD